MAAEDLDLSPPRMPATWGECERTGLGTAARPCPFVACKHHLALDVNPATGVLTVHHDDLDAMTATCALRVAAEGEHTLERVGSLLGVTRERIRRIEERALVKLRTHPAVEGSR